MARETVKLGYRTPSMRPLLASGPRPPLTFRSTPTRSATRRAFTCPKPARTREPSSSTSATPDFRAVISQEPAGEVFSPGRLSAKSGTKTAQTSGRSEGGESLNGTAGSNPLRSSSESVRTAGPFYDRRHPESRSVVVTKTNTHQRTFRSTENRSRFSERLNSAPLVRVVNPKADRQFESPSLHQRGSANRRSVSRSF
jgi:hypothetical protein